MDCIKPELTQLGSAPQVVLGDAPHSGTDYDSVGTQFLYTPVPEQELEA